MDLMLPWLNRFLSIESEHAQLALLHHDVSMHQLNCMG